ncbi:MULTISPECIES: hypothetical protein [unclassified Sphingobacterium]|uniref:hypothetical protein n=1 Tax=unclassified Sphingobacterium TaxID=2609468 RepID=UPI0025E4B72A|nr:MULTISPECIES: hypothetical protein [unclassified Sphingobacterium]
MEVKHSSRESSIPNFEQIDWSAISYLQKKISKCQCDFRIEAYEKSIEKILDIPKRKAKDIKLAEEVFKDSKRELARKNTSSTRFGKSVEDYNYLQNQQTAILEFEFDDRKRDYKSIIYRGLYSLTQRERTALYIKATNRLDVIASLLGISERQYRNIVKLAQQKLHNFPGFKEAFFLAFLDTNFEEYDSFLMTFLFNNDFSTPSKAK